MYVSAVSRRAGRFVRPALTAVMQNDGYFVDVILIYTWAGRFVTTQCEFHPRTHSSHQQYDNRTWYNYDYSCTKLLKMARVHLKNQTHFPPLRRLQVIRRILT